MSQMELEGALHGVFPMDKDEGIKACKAYRERLHAQGYKTYLRYLWGGLFQVEIVDPRRYR